VESLLRALPALQMGLWDAGQIMGSVFKKTAANPLPTPENLGTADAGRNEGEVTGYGRGWRRATAIEREFLHRGQAVSGLVVSSQSRDSGPLAHREIIRRRAFMGRNSGKKTMNSMPLAKEARVVSG